MRQLRQPYRKLLKPLRDIMGGGLPLQRGVHRQHHFIEAAVRHPTDQRLHRKIFRPNAIQRRKPAAKHMEAAGKQPGPIQRPKIGNLLHHAQQPGVTTVIAAYGAGIDSVDIAAGRTGGQCLVHPLQCMQQRGQRRLPPLEHMQHRAACRTRAKTGQPRQGLGQRIDFS